MLFPGFVLVVLIVALPAVLAGAGLHAGATGAARPDMKFGCGMPAVCAIGVGFFLLTDWGLKQPNEGTPQPFLQPFDSIFTAATVFKVLCGPALLVCFWITLQAFARGRLSRPAALVAIALPTIFVIFTILEVMMPTIAVTLGHSAVITDSMARAQKDLGGILLVLLASQIALGVRAWMVTRSTHHPE